MFSVNCGEPVTVTLSLMLRLTVTVSPTFSVLLTMPVLPEMITEVTLGAVVSTIRLKLLASPKLPLASAARTFRVCRPEDKGFCT